MGPISLRSSNEQMDVVPSVATHCNYVINEAILITKRNFLKIRFFLILTYYKILF